MNNYKDIYNEDLSSKDWFGIIVDNQDPLLIGRVKVRVFELFDQRKPINEFGDYPDTELSLKEYTNDENFLISKTDLPWIMPTQPLTFGGGSSNGAGSFSFPKLQTVVRVKFSAGDIYSGEYTSIVKPNESMIGFLQGDDYINSQVILFDEDENLRIIYTKSIGIQIFHKESQFVIRPDSSIFIEHKDSESMLEFKGSDITMVANRQIDITATDKVTVNSEYIHINGINVDIGTQPVFSSVNGEPLIQLLNALAVIIDTKISPTPGVAVGAVQSAQSTILSKSVKTTL